MSDLVNALLRKPTDKIPLWLMRQAGRYLPEYREIRTKAGSFMNLCSNPELACQVTLQPLKRFELDAAILFSDILTIPDALGLGLGFTPGEGPKFQHSITNIEQINALPNIEPEQELGYVMQTIKLIKSELKQDTPLIGFAGSPWTVATYMLENGSSKTFSKSKKLLFNQPEAMHKLLDKLTYVTAKYLQAQIDAGVDVIMLFDTWGGVLATEDYQEFSLAYMQKILETTSNVNKNNTKIPKIIFTKGGGQWLQTIATTGCDAIGLDWTTPIAKAKKMVGDKVALQGNLDPNILYANEAVIRAKVKELLNSMTDHSGYVFNLGHGMQPDMDPGKVGVLINAVRSWH